MNMNPLALRLVAAALLFALSLLGLDVVDSARTVVVVGGYVWFAALAGLALVLLGGAFRSRRAQ